MSLNPIVLMMKINHHVLSQKPKQQKSKAKQKETKRKKRKKRTSERRLRGDSAGRSTHCISMRAWSDSGTHIKSQAWPLANANTVWRPRQEDH